MTSRYDGLPFEQQIKRTAAEDEGERLARRLIDEPQDIMIVVEAASTSAIMTASLLFSLMSLGHEDAAMAIAEKIMMVASVRGVKAKED
jgi:hypothetical protein